MKRLPFNSWIYYWFFCLGMLKICRGNYNAFLLVTVSINALIRNAQIQVYNDILKRMDEDD